MYDASAVALHMHQIQIDTASFRQLLRILDVMAYVTNKRQPRYTTDYFEQPWYLLLIRRSLKWAKLFANFRPEKTVLCERAAGADVALAEHFTVGKIAEFPGRKYFRMLSQYHIQDRRSTMR